MAEKIKDFFMGKKGLSIPLNIELTKEEYDKVVIFIAKLIGERQSPSPQ